MTYYVVAHFHYVLSMGAVFALYSGWYFWIPKILGLDYNLLYSKAHFWVLFAGVNLTFFPQHFLGLQGMPRRISDYPDAFTGWNFVSSIGSVISVAATALFLQIVYLQLVTGKAVFGYPWAVPQLFSDYFRILKDRTAPGLEWALHSPPKPHAFTSLPLQSMGMPDIASIDPDAIAIALSNYFELKAKAAAIIQNCAHTFDMRVTVSPTEIAQGLIPNCDFNKNGSLQAHPAITQTWTEFSACSKCYAVMCLNCHHNALLLVTNCNIFLILSNIRKIISVLAKFGYKNSIFSLIIIIFISSLMFYLPDLFVLSYVGFSNYVLDSDLVCAFAPTLVLSTGHGSGSGSGLTTDQKVEHLESDVDIAPNYEDLTVGSTPSDIRNKGDQLIADFEGKGDQLIAEIDSKIQDGTIDQNKGGNLKDRVEEAKEGYAKVIKESANTAMENAYGDGSDTEDHIYEDFLPIFPFFIFEIPLLTTIITSLAAMVDAYFGGLICILLQIYRLYKLPSRIIKLINLSIKIYNFISNYKKSLFSLMIIILISSLMFYLPDLFVLSYSCTEYIGFNITECDAPRAWGLYFQDSASPQMEALVELHDNIMYYLVAILLAVGWIQAAIIRNFQSSRSPISNKYLNHGTLIELIWTITPNIKAYSWVKLPNSGEVLVISYTKL